MLTERSTDIGCIINDYLTGKLKLTDQQIHFLFALNRKELMLVKLLTHLFLI